MIAAKVGLGSSLIVALSLAASCSVGAKKGGSSAAPASTASEGTSLTPSGSSPSTPNAPASGSDNGSGTSALPAAFNCTPIYSAPDGNGTIIDGYGISFGFGGTCPAGFTASLLGTDVFCIPPYTLVPQGQAAFGSCNGTGNYICPAGFIGTPIQPNINLGAGVAGTFYGAQYNGSGTPGSSWDAYQNSYGGCNLAADPGNHCVPSTSYTNGSGPLGAGKSIGSCLPSASGACPAGFTLSKNDVGPYGTNESAAGPYDAVQGCFTEDP